MNTTERSLNNAIAFIRILITNYQLPKEECLSQMKNIFPRLAVDYFQEYPDDNLSMLNVNPISEQKAEIMSKPKNPKKIIKKLSSDSESFPEQRQESILSAYVQSSEIKKNVNLEIDSEPEQDPPQNVADNDSNDQVSDSSCVEEKSTQNEKSSQQNNKKSKRAKKREKKTKEVCQEEMQESKPQNSETYFLDKLSEEKGFSPNGISGFKPIQGFEMFGKKKKFRIWSKEKIGEGEFSSLSTPIKVRSFSKYGISFLFRYCELLCC